MTSLQERYKTILSQISDERSPSSPAVTLIAVSKFQPVEAIQTLYELGQRDFGENYVQELLEKDRNLRERGIQDIRWHFIGHLQRNKVKALLPVVHAIHTVDSIELAQELSKRSKALKISQPVPVFLEVNLHSETSKAGFEPSEIQSRSQTISALENLEVLGLMCIPDPTFDPKTSFAALKALEFSCHPFTRGALSMGMSNDYPIALQEGATHIRVGTSLFGERQRS